MVSSESKQQQTTPQACPDASKMSSTSTDKHDRPGAHGIDGHEKQAVKQSAAESDALTQAPGTECLGTRPAELLGSNGNDNY